MKKKVLSIILATLMIAVLLPITAFAGTTHDFTVTKNDGTAAEEDVDYEWMGEKLNIKVSGLTVTGTTTHNYIDIIGVENVTIKDLTGNYGSGLGFSAIGSDCDTEIILEGTNTFSGVELDSKAFSSFHDLTISGSGNMNATFPNGCISLMSGASLTLKCSGNIVLDSSGYHGLYVDGDLNVDPLTGKVLVYGNYDNFGAIGQFNSFTLGEGLVMKGDTAYKTAEDAILSDIDNIDVAGGGYLKINDSCAKSVLITVAETEPEETEKEPEETEKEPEATEKEPEATEKEPIPPLTGDSNNMSIWVILMELSFIGLCAYLIFNRKEKANNK